MWIDGRFDKTEILDRLRAMNVYSACLIRGGLIVNGATITILTAT